MSYLRAVLVASGALLLGACVTITPTPTVSAPSVAAPTPAVKPVPVLGPAEQKLADGIKRYDDGDFKASMAALHGALDLGLGSKVDQANAHKYLAFIHCVSRREKQCHEEFRKALESNPDFDLQPAEAGHPLWGSAFRKEKAKFAKTAK